MLPREIRRFSAALACVAFVAFMACNEQRIGGAIAGDQTPPIVAIQTDSDTTTVAQGIGFTVNAVDNLGLKNLSVELTGGLTARIDSTFRTAVTSVAIPLQVVLPSNTTAGGIIVITATVLDGNDNAGEAVDSIFLLNDQALIVRLTSPTNGAVTSAGKQLVVRAVATQAEGVAKAGYTVSGAFTTGDSTVATAPLPDTLVFEDTLTVPAGLTSGNFTITGFGEDGEGRRATSTPVTITIQSAANDNTGPAVRVTVDPRVEVDDSVTVNATDPSGISRIGWTATVLGSGTIIGGDSASFNGNLTDITRTFALGFNFATLPQSVVITGFAVDGAGNRGTSASSSAPAGAPAAAAQFALDTVLVVNGITRALPRGGKIADAIYNENLHEIFMTNIDLDRLEIFRLVDSTFVTTGIPVGSQPWGIARYPIDTLGTTNSQFVVANSGGTNLSIVGGGSRRELRRHALPNFLIQSVQTEIDPATGLLKLKIEEFDFSDRPQYVGTTCRPTTGSTACAADSVYAVYSTTPTEAQPDPFFLRGSIRWENLTSATPQSHFFWEHAEKAPSPDTDTLQVLVDRGPGTAIQTILSAACGRTVNMVELGFLDTTFVRNSGNFTHALIGEGGSSVDPAVMFARAIGYDGTVGVASTNCTATILGTTFSGPEEVDLGITPGIRVRDFVVNTAIAVKSIGINFNGLTGLIRADSVYVLDEGLRLQGIVTIGGPNPGMDLNFDHAFDAREAGTPTFGGTLDPNDRLMFAAAAGPTIEVFDTFFYGKVATIPIKDPIIGPLRVARAASGAQILVGVTPAGVVVVELPAITNIFQAREWGEPLTY